MTPNYGIIVGRFQVPDLHDGHLELFRTVRGLHNRIIVFVGVSPTGMTRRNPLDFEVRKRMIQNKFPEFTVLPIVDVSSDHLWSENLDKAIETVVQWGGVTLYGGRDSFVPHYHGTHKPVELGIPGTTTGTKIRDAITNTVMESSDFRAGIIYAAQTLRPRVIPCVDIVVVYSSPKGQEVLLAKKPGEEKWRFVGGHAEPKGTFEEDARREVFEETGCSIGELDYLGSVLVDDWRWQNDPDKIKTVVFCAFTTDYAAKARDDVSEVKWFSAKDVKADMLVSEHRPILTLLEAV